MAYATLADLKTYLGIDADCADDALLSAVLTRATAALETYTGRTFHAAAATVRKFDAAADVDGARLWLGADCAAISSVVNGDGSTISAAQYSTLPRHSTPFYALRLRGAAGCGWTYTSEPEDAISVTGYWAYSITPPADIVQACVRWAAHMFRLKDAQVFDALQFAEAGAISVNPGIPQDVKAIMDAYRLRL